MSDTYIKSIVLKKQTYIDFKNTLKERYYYLKFPRCAFSDFESWSLVAMILGIFTGYGDTTSSSLFLECLEKEYLPEFIKIDNDNNVKICICINLNDRSKIKQHS